MRSPQNSFTGGEFAPSLWGRTDVAKYRSAARLMKNVVVHPHGGVSNRAGSVFVYDLGGDGLCVPFQFNVDQTYMLVFTNNKLRIARDGGLVVYPVGHPSVGQVVEIATPYVLADLLYLRFAQSADTLFITHPSYQSRTLTRTDHHLWTFTELYFSTNTASPAGLTATPAISGNTNYDYQVFAATAGDVLGTGSAVRTVSGRSPWGGTVTVSWAAVVGADHYVIYRGGVARAAVSGTTWIDTDATPAVASHTGGGGLAAPATISAFFLPPTAGREYQYAVSAVVANAESLPSAAITAGSSNPWAAGERIVLSWGAVANAELYNVYKNSRGQWGWIGNTTGTSFTDDNINPDVTFGVRGDPIYDFDVAEKYAAAVALFQQRLMLAGTNENPTDVGGSRIASLLDFSVSSPTRADDPFFARPASGRVDEIRHLLPFNGLLIFTAGSEWILAGADGSLRANNFEFKLQSYFGCAEYPAPLPIGKSALFVERNRRTVRDLAYSLEADGYDGRDLTVFAPHAFSDSPIRSWSHQQYPDGVIWCAREDGTMRALTYLREHEVFAWTRYETLGEVRSIASITSAGVDVAYMIVKRTIGGVAKYYLETMAQRAVDGVFLDSALTYEGSPADVITGLGHLNGQAVRAVADGFVVQNLTVASGQITLPFEASVVHVGLPYESRIQTLDIDLGGENQGRRQKITGVTLRLQDTVGLRVGPNGRDIYELPFRTFEAPGEPTAAYTGDKRMALMPKYQEQVYLEMVQDLPLPFTILAIVPEVELGG